MQKMKNRKKKGFTLIELLAVIVILAILALIAIPIVINIINDSRENSHKRSIQTYGRAVENAIATWQSKNDGQLPENISDYVIQTSGEKVECQNKIEDLDSDDGITLRYCHTLDKQDKSSSKDYKYQNGQVYLEGESEQQSEDEQPQSYQAYSVGEIIKVNNMNDEYYVIANSGEDQDYVTALKAEPLTVDEVNTNKIGEDGQNHVNRYLFHSYGVGEAKNINGYGGLSYYTSPNCGYPDPNRYATDTSGCGIENANSYDISDIKYIVNQWASTKFIMDELKQIDGYYVRLITLDEIHDFGYENSVKGCGGDCDVYNVTNSVPTWLYNSNYHYWTMSSSVKIKNAWVVEYNGSIYDCSVINSDTVIRPVINVKKSAIQS